MPLPAFPDAAPVAEPTADEAVDTPWRVILYDDDIHTFDEVILQLIRATGCSEQQAERHAFTVHTAGKDCVYQGDFFDCFQVQGVLRQIQLVTEIEG
ncbi:ATP-dependent Clp protease adaptor ClpS [Rubrivirga sp. S365]|uniref:ATP-dependent Clp protease adaptor ClpS n=1 Tax=Rubrivirga litoralis TaxID=3075598 RepID=A0ABU3BVH0_9BACT|nr:MULTISPECIES: ATP-dependent Clp protease adaptor ClpS [unclassified Rubrivirga]MDT0633283.1 ATP-dependent Clp protease adaptor ClpS [Rubrivirga sp. F394]MDT7857280.1 ATP-dependent Clp protease adaptor ClpS [Rubrivirga sp. S365]